MTVRRLGIAAGVPLVGLVLGLGVAIGANLASLSPDRHGETSGFVPPTSRLPSPSPTVTTPGALGGAARLITNGSNTIIALGAGSILASADGGHTWSGIRPPAQGSGLAVDPSNPRHAVSGGSSIQVTSDGGTTWTSVQTAPPGKGPYQPVAISALEPSVWFFVHQGRLLMTRDGSASWVDLASLPALSSPDVVAGQVVGQFFVASGSRVFELTGYTQSITELPALSAGAIADLAVVGGNRPSLLARVAGHGAYMLQGATWAQATDLTGPVAGGSGGAALVGNGGAKLGAPAIVSYSTDGGRTWRPATGLPFDQTVEAIAGQPASSQFFAYCYGGDIYASGDAGRTWSLLTRALRSAND